MTFSKLFTFLIVLTTIVASTAQAESTFERVMRTKTLNCGYTVWAPYVIKDANTGELSGINYEAMEAIGRYLGLKVNWNMEVGVGDIAAVLNGNKVDAICITQWPSIDRFRTVTFTNRVQFYSTLYAVSRYDDKRFDGDLLKGNNPEVKSVGIEGDVTYDIVKEMLPKAKHIALSSSTSPAEFIMQLTTKKADILFVDKGGVYQFSQSSPNTIKIVENIEPARIYGEHIVVKLGEIRLRDVIDMALLQLTNDGVLNRLVKKYAEKYHTDIFPPKKDIDR